MAGPAASVSKLKQLIDVAKDGGDGAREGLLRDITDVFMAAPDRYTSTELQHFDVILSKVAESVETALRREIAEKLADVPSAPRNLIRQLAHDDFLVAEPVLKRSLALSADDLVRVIRQRGQDHMKAISERREVPEPVTAELVDKGGKDVLVALAQNRGAKFTDDSMEKLVEHSRSIGELQAPVAARYDLPPQLLTQMYFFVSSALKREILKRSDLLDPRLIDEAVETNRKKILKDAVVDAEQDVTAARRYVEERIRANAVNEALLKDLMEKQRKTEFLLAFSHHCGVDPATAQRILSDRSFESLAIAARSAGLERSTFAKIVFGVQRGEDEQQKALRILDLYLKVPQEAAERVMRFWRLRMESPAPATGEAAGPEPAPKPQGIHALAEHAAAARR